MLHLHLSLSTSHLRQLRTLFIAPSAATQFFLSLSSASSETHFSVARDTKCRRGIETPTSPLSRRRPADEAWHVLDVQVERVMRASAARLGYEWRRTKRRDKLMAETLLHLSHELQLYGHTVTLLGLLVGSRGPIPAPSAIAGVVTRVSSLERSVEFHEQALLELERQASVVDKLESRVEEIEQRMVQLNELTDLVKGTRLVVTERGKKLEKSVRDVDLTVRG